MPTYRVTMTFTTDDTLSVLQQEQLRFGVYLEGNEPVDSDGEHADWSGGDVVVTLAVETPNGWEELDV